MNTPASPVIVGLEAIGEVFGRTRWTIRRWIEREGFPASRLPDGTWTTSQTLIDAWLLARAGGISVSIVRHLPRER